MQAAKREFAEECGCNIELNFYSSAPSAVFSYNHPSEESNVIGSKVSIRTLCYTLIIVLKP